MMLTLIFFVIWHATTALSLTHRQVVRLSGNSDIYVLAETLGEPDSRGDATSRQLWPASRAAAKFIDELRPQSVVELGCGLGLPSLVAAANGARVTATDIDEEALTLCATAAREQGLHVETRVFDLCGPEPLPTAEVYIIADVAADARLTKALVHRVDEALSLAKVVVVAMQRDRAQRQPLWESFSTTEDRDAALDACRRALLDEEETLGHLVLLDVDENDQRLYY